jgi:hypothetical protein
VNEDFPPLPKKIMFHGEERPDVLVVWKKHARSVALDAEERAIPWDLEQIWFDFVHDLLVFGLLYTPPKYEPPIYEAPKYEASKYGPPPLGNANDTFAIFKIKETNRDADLKQALERVSSHLDPLHSDIPSTWWIQARRIRTEGLRP